VLMHPSGVKVSMMNANHKRLHHLVKWNNTVPKIIRETNKKQPLIKYKVSFYVVSKTFDSWERVFESKIDIDKLKEDDISLHEEIYATLNKEFKCTMIYEILKLNNN